MQNAKPVIGSAPAAGDLISEISLRVSAITGVQLGLKQRVMVTNRMQKRITELGLTSIASYAVYFAAHRDAEVQVMLSLLTTHHTYFFREFAHFSYLRDHALAVLGAQAKKRGAAKLKVWSAACSRGQESYSLAMLMAEHLPAKAPGIGFDILGTDVDPESVAIAANGVYQRREIKEIPLPLQDGHWAKGSGEIADFVRAKASIRQSCRFAVGNLLNAQLAAGEGPFDIIFCRNVFIYFTAEQVQEIAARLLKRLTPQGMLFVGISESLHGMNLPLEVLGPSIYTPAQAKPARSEASTAVVTLVKPLAKTAAAAPLRVFCVDDSPSILALLKRMLTAEHGFTVVGTAANGFEAQRGLAALGAGGVDLVTLDIHMPEQSGPDYLQANFNPSHPAVVVISSVSRDDTTLAERCFSHGATDYVEKPTLLNFLDSSEEIRTKLRCAFHAAKNAPGGFKAKSPERLGQRDLHLAAPERCLTVAVAALSDSTKIAALVREGSGPQPPLLILVEGAGAVLAAFSQQLTKLIGREVLVFSGGALALAPLNTITVASARETLPLAMEQYRTHRTSVLCFTAPTPQLSDKLCSWRGAQILLETSLAAIVPEGLVQRADDIVPATSFAYMATLFLSLERVKP